MNTPGFVLANTLRNRRRTLLTLASLAASIFLLTTLEGLLRFMSENAQKTGSAHRIIVRRKTSLQDRLPESYVEKIRAVPGIECATPMVWFGGIYIDFQPKYMFGQLSCEPEVFRRVVPEAEVVDVETGLPVAPSESNDPYRDFVNDRTGAFAARELFLKYDWKPGDKITLRGMIYPVDLELTLRAAYHAKSGTDNQTLYYHQKYLDERLGRPGLIGVVSARVAEPDQIPSIIAKIDGMFENSDFETLTETERAFQLGFLKMLGNITTLIRSISVAVAVTMLLVAANTTAMAARERTYEIAVMKAIGFPVGRVVATLLSEAMVIGLAGSLAGVALAFGLTPALNWLGQQSFMSFFLYGYTLDPRIAATAVAVGTTVALAAAVLPSLRVARQPIAITIRRTA